MSTDAQASENDAGEQQEGSPTIEEEHRRFQRSGDWGELGVDRLTLAERVLEW